jgi:uncharacterized membrane protein
MIPLKRIFLNISFFLNILLIFFLIFEDRLEGLPRWMHVAGRTHPMLLHFPIALLVVALLFEFFGRSKSNDHFDDKMEFLLSFSAMAASATAIVGLILFHTGDYEPGSTLQWHKWTGVAVALLSWILISLRKIKMIVYQSVLAISVFVTIVAGHYGASITHGEDFLMGPLEVKAKRIKDLDKAIVFTDIIQPLLNEKCTGCHNPNRAKGELQLISKQTILKGGEDGEIITPGNADSSRMYSYLLLPLDDDNHMPPEGKPQLDEEEIKMIKWWIESGADFSRTLAAIKPPDSIHSIIKAKYGIESPLDALDISFASQETIASLNNESRGVRQISAEKPFIDVYLGNKKTFDEKDLGELKPISNQIVSIDLANSEISDAHMEQIAGFPHLRTLHLENTNITDTGLQRLSKLKYLEYLNISNTAVTDNALKTLGSFPALKKVFFYQTNIPANSIVQYQSSKPGLIVGYTPDLSSDTAFRGRLAAPVVKVDSNLFVHHATVEMNYRLKGVKLHYTSNGDDPTETSPVYSKPLIVDSSCVLKVIAIKEGWESSAIQEHRFTHAPYRFADARLSNPPDKRYKAKLDTTLIDLERGSDSHADNKYIGYEGEDVTVTLDLGTIRELTKLSLGYVVNHGAYVIAPAGIEIFGRSGETNSLKKLGEQNLADKSFKQGSEQRTAVVRFNKQRLRYITVRIKNPKTLPFWHPNKGSKSWMFLDEIIVN